MSSAPPPVPQAAPGIALLPALRDEGNVFLQAPQMRALLEATGPLSDWPDFVQSWNDMPVDTYMADGGRYRRRRHAVFRADAQGIARQPHQPHWQSRDYNTLNGGIERWFEPVAGHIGSSDSLQTVLRFCHGLFGLLAPEVGAWHIETHQFRIEALEGLAGNPTPEGVHRDGVDYVLVLLIRRHNIASGTTTIHAPDGRTLGSFTLTQAFDATLIDDARVHHGVTPVEALRPGEPAYRDVLVATFRRLLSE